MSWYFDEDELRRSASAQDGIPFETEFQYRREGARFIIDGGTKMDLGHTTVATGVVYFHRFYMYHSFNTFPVLRTASCCLFLAGKVEETPKKCRDIIKTAKELLPKDKYKTLGSNPKKELMILEKIVLQTIKFDMNVNHPYQFLTKYAKCLKGDEAKRTIMVQMAWTFVNDSLCTTLCLQWEPEIIAISLMHLASKLSKFELNDWEGRTSKHLFWWDMFVSGMSIELIENICHQVLDLYSLPSINAPSSSLALDKSVVPKKIVPPQSVGQKLILHNMTVEYMLKSEEVMQGATTKNVKMASTPIASSAKPLSPVPSEINPLPLNSMLPSKTQNVPKPFLPSTPTQSKLLEQLQFKKPPLPLSKPPLLTVPSLPPLPSLPPPSLLPSPPSVPLSLLMISQGVSQWPLLPTPPSGFLNPMFPPYPLLQNAAHSYANMMFSQPANLTNEVSGQYRPHETMVSMGVHCNSGLRPPYGECSHPRENRLQQKSQSSPKINSEIQGSYEGSRQKNIDTLAFNRGGAFVGGGYNNGSQHYTDSSRRYSDNVQYYVNGGSQHYPVNQQLGENTPNQQDFYHQNNPSLPSLPQCQNRRVRKRRYRKQ